MAKRTPEPLQIVIAWTEPSFDVVSDRLTTARGDGLNPVNATRETVLAKTVLWLRHGTAVDIANAQDHARTISDTAEVFTFQTSEPDPLGRAKTLILRNRA